MPADFGGVTSSTQASGRQSRLGAAVYVWRRSTSLQTTAALGIFAVLVVLTLVLGIPRIRDGDILIWVAPLAAMGVSQFSVRLSSLDYSLYLGFEPLMFAVLFARAGSWDLLCAAAVGVILGRAIVMGNIALSVRSFLTVIPGLVVVFVVQVLFSLADGRYPDLSMPLARSIWQSVPLFACYVSAYALTGIAASILWYCFYHQSSIGTALRALSGSRIVLYILAATAVGVVQRWIASMVWQVSTQIGLLGVRMMILAAVSLLGFGIVELVRKQALQVHIRGLLRVMGSLPWSPNTSQVQQVIGAVRMVLPVFSRVFPAFAVPLSDSTGAARERRRDRLLSATIESADQPFGIAIERSWWQRPFSIEDRAVVDAVVTIADQEFRTSQHLESVERMARTDALTGVLNLWGLREALRELDRQRVMSAWVPVAFMFVDLNDFKRVNDTHGHDVGDAALQAVAGRLKWAAGDDGIIARVGGDEFVVVISGEHASRNVQMTASRIDRLMADPVQVGNVSLVVSVSYGVAVATPQDARLEDVLHDADSRMYAMKAGRVLPGSPSVASTSELLPARTMGFSHLGVAIAEGWTTVSFQPVIDIRDNSVVAVEALLRYRDGELGPVPAPRVLMEARRLGLLGELTRRVLEDSFAAMADFRQVYPWLHRVHVNVDASQLFDSDVLATVDELLAAHPQIDLVAELYEGSLHDLDADFAMRVAGAVAGRRIWLALDDVGKSGASLTALGLFPFQEVKLDKCLIDGWESSQMRAVMSTITQMITQRLGARVVFEGVEHAEQVQCVRDMGGFLVQGFAFMPALEHDAMMDYLRRVPPPARLELPGEQPK